VEIDPLVEEFTALPTLRGVRCSGLPSLTIQKPVLKRGVFFQLYAFSKIKSREREGEPRQKMQL